MTFQQPSRNLALELVRVTETAVIAASRWVGRGAKNEADQAAVDGVRKMINTVSMNGLFVIGEGEKDEAPMLFNGELLRGVRFNDRYISSHSLVMRSRSKTIRVIESEHPLVYQIAYLQRK